MLSTSTIDRLRSHGIEASHAQDFISGLKLMQLVCQILYEGEDRTLASKLRLTEQQKTGINVLNINIILNHLKKDPNVHLPEEIRALSAFKIIEEEKAMIQIVEWLLSYSKQRPQPSRLQEEMSPPREQDNQFDNLYFVASLQKQERLMNDSLDQEDNPQEKVVRRGSFKMLKPKLSTASKQSVDENARDESVSLGKKTENSIQKEPLKEHVYFDPNIVDSEDRDELQCRKTIPKMYQRPPLYKSKQKDQTTNQKFVQKKGSPPETTKRLIDREQILQNIDSINKQIVQEQKSLSMNVDESKTDKRSRRSSRKIFKIQMAEVQDSKKKVMVEWLISINLLNSSSSKYVSQLHTICKDGVVFIQIMNYYRGRGKEVCYFKEPKRPAELHSNYQKLFAFLNQQVEFKSQLLHQYEYFIPEVQPNSFWCLLASIHQCFNKRVQPKQTTINRYENSIGKKIQRESSKKKILNQSASYGEIKYNSNSLKKQPKTNYSSTELHKKETPTPKRTTQSNENVLEKSVAPYGLVQNEQPNEQVNNSRTQRGYKEMYLCKFKNMQTPTKTRSFHNTSLSRSRLKLSVGSSKKKQIKPVIPSISLQMQMKVLQYLDKMTIENDIQQLFKDPYRNGVLLCSVVKKSIGIDFMASQKPKNIEDCRHNFISAIETIRSYRQNFNVNYEYLVEDLVRGDRVLLYGLIWQAIREEEKECKIFDASSDFNHRNKAENGFISWIRSVQRSYPDIGVYRIRDEESLFQAITGTDFLFRYSWFITGKRAVTATYERPINDIQKQSNLKKSIGYLVQNKIVRSDYLWKTRTFIKEDSSLLKEFITDLVSHYNHLHKKQQTKTVNFVRYLKKEDSESREKPFEKLETTMGNQTLNQNHQQNQPETQKLEIGWMKKLGFTGPFELNNGVILCKLMSKLTMKTITGLHENPQSKAECLGNIRKAIKHIPKFRWNQYDILDCDFKRNTEIYSFIKDRFRHSYAMKGI